ncbi:MAG: hypothetical protein AABY65_09920 [Nitrospirota bacterium]|mgnify:CR=1 FL=1
MSPVCVKLSVKRPVREAPRHLCVSARAYKKPLPHAKVRGFIERKSGKRRDPRVVQAFLRREDEFMAVFQALSGQEGRAD